MFYWVAQKLALYQCFIGLPKSSPFTKTERWFWKKNAASTDSVKREKVENIVSLNNQLLTQTNAVCCINSVHTISDKAGD